MMTLTSEGAPDVRLKIKHNMEVAHRLSLTPGKCQQIHGHGMQVELLLLVTEGTDGMAVNGAGLTLEFGALKKAFRTHIDTKYDHHLLLNESDPWALATFALSSTSDGKLPGLVTFPGDPTVENLARWIAEWACNEFKCDVICRLEETKTNGAEVMFHWNGWGASMVRGAL